MCYIFVLNGLTEHGIFFNLSVCDVGVLCLLYYKTFLDLLEMFLFAEFCVLMLR